MIHLYFMQVHLGTNNHSFIQYIKMSWSTLHAERASPLDLSSQHMYIYNNALILLHYLYNVIMVFKKNWSHLVSLYNLSIHTWIITEVFNFVVYKSGHYTHQMYFLMYRYGCIINKDSSQYYLET